MAQPTKIIRRSEVDVNELREQELHELEEQLLMHKDTLLNLFRLLEQLDDHEVFNALNAALAKSDPILTRVLKALNETELDKAIRNLLLISQGLGKFKLDELEPMTLKINKGFERSTKQHQTMSIFSLMKVLVSPTFIKGALFLTTFVQGFGYDAEQLKQEQGIVDPVQTDTGDLKQHKVEHTRRNSNVWMDVTLGAAVLSTSILLYKKFNH